MSKSNNIESMKSNLKDIQKKVREAEIKEKDFIYKSFGKALVGILKKNNNQQKLNQIIDACNGKSQKRIKQNLKSVGLALAELRK
jgi:hypothetical protein